MTQVYINDTQYLSLFVKENEFFKNDRGQLRLELKYQAVLMVNFVKDYI